MQYTQNLNYLFCIFADWDVYNVSASCGLEYLIWDSRTPTVSVTRSVEPCESVCGLLTESWIGCWALVMWSVDLYGLASQMSNTPFTRDQSVWARGRGRFAALPLQLLCLLELIARPPACLPYVDHSTWRPKNIHWSVAVAMAWIRVSENINAAIRLTQETQVRRNESPSW